MNRRAFLTGAGGSAATAVAGCAGLLDGGGNSGHGEDIDQYHPWLVAPPRDAEPDRSYWTRLTDVDRGRAIADSGYSFESGEWLVPDVPELDREAVERTLQVAVPRRRSHGGFLVCFGSFDTDQIREAVLANTDEETRQIGGATMTYDPQSEKWIGIGEDWIVTHGPVVVPAYGADGIVELALESVAGERNSAVDEISTLQRLTEQVSLHRSLEVNYFPNAESERYSWSELPSLPLAGETMTARVNNGRYERQERYVFVDGTEIPERPFVRHVEDRTQFQYEEGSYTVGEDVVTVEFHGPAGSQPE